MKKCKLCGIEKPIAEFYFRKDSQNHRSECKLCTQEKERYKKFGISISDYYELLVKQRGACAICNCSLDSSRYTKMAIDHNHKTGKIRGLLCTACNTSLGLMKESVERLQSAIKYLETNESKEIVCS